MTEPAQVVNDPFVETKYQKPFIRQVIVRLDWAVPLTAFNETLPPAIRTAALKYFPIPDPQKLKAQRVTVAAGSVTTGEQAESWQWLFYGKEREKMLSLTADALFITYQRYETYEAVCEEFFSVVRAVLELHPQNQASRVGLRYINEIELQEGNPLEWAEYIRDPMLCILDVPPDRNRVARAFQRLEMNYGDLFLIFQYGLFNPDYPAIIKRKSFVLDLDGYTAGLQTEADVHETLDRAHAIIQQLFESSITNALRAKMNG